MDDDKISVISIEFQSYNENQREINEDKKNITKDKKTSSWNIFHVFSVLIICVLFLATNYHYTPDQLHFLSVALV